MKRTATVIVLAAVFAIVAGADARPAPPGLPNLLCRKPTFPGRADQTTAGSFSYRPHSCSMEIFQKSPGFEQSSHLLAIRWLRWERSSAYGLGKIPIIEENLRTGDQRIGREKVRITLSRPVMRCGKLVFTRAHVEWYFGGFDYPFRLHEVPVVGRGCPPSK
ncbi:MAG TPA: hypothetical protein VMF55_12510 [Solirubrobacterales bacterium]|nr:hypothetical protein [Solirubrobacterales bacterium]